MHSDAVLQHAEHRCLLKHLYSLHQANTCNQHASTTVHVALMPGQLFTNCCSNDHICSFVLEKRSLPQCCSPISSSIQISAVQLCTAHSQHGKAHRIWQDKSYIHSFWHTMRRCALRTAPWDLRERSELGVSWCFYSRVPDFSWFLIKLAQTQWFITHAHRNSQQHFLGTFQNGFSAAAQRGTHA